MKNKKFAMLLILGIVSSISLVGCKQANVVDDAPSVDTTKEMELLVDQKINDLRVEMKEFVTDELTGLQEDLTAQYELNKSFNQASQDVEEEEKEPSIALKPTDVLKALPEEESLPIDDVLQIKSVIYANVMAAQTKDAEAFKGTMISELATDSGFEAFVTDTFDKYNADFSLNQILIKSIDEGKAIVEVSQVTSITDGDQESSISTANWELVKEESGWKIGRTNITDLKEIDSIDETNNSQEDNQKEISSN